LRIPSEDAPIEAARRQEGAVGREREDIDAIGVAPQRENTGVAGRKPVIADGKIIAATGCEDKRAVGEGLPAESNRID
jgi:hypothetical protein